MIQAMRVRSDTRRARRGRPLREVMLQGRELSATAHTLEQVLYGKNVPRSQNERAYHGRSVDLNVIETAIKQAAAGNMIAVTDLGREAVLGLDGHTAGVLNKRLNRAGAIDWMVVANSGIGRIGYDHERARARADFVRSQLMRIPYFRESLTDMAWSTWDNRSASEVRWEVGRGSTVGDSSLMTGWRAADLFWIHPRRLSYNQDRDVVVLDDGQEWSASRDFRPKGFRLDDIPEKFIISTPRLFNDYREREGLLLRVMYWSFFQRLGTRERLELMEVFGSPWRLVTSKDKIANTEAIRESFETIEQMSARKSGWLVPGAEAEFIQPNAGAGQVHKEVIEDARYVISKFVLGGVATTDAVSTGLGSSIGDVQLTEEDMIIAADLFQRAAVIEHRLIDPMIELNYGPTELEYSPEFKFNIRGVTDIEKNGRALKSALDVGVDVPLEQAYEMMNIRQPRENEPRLSLVSVPSEFGQVETRPRTVYPAGTAPAPGDLALQPEEALDVPTPAPGAPQLQPGQVTIPNPDDPNQVQVLELTPSDLASIVTVNEGRESIGKGPLTKPDGTRDPDGDLTIAEFVIKRQAAGEVVGKGEGQKDAPPGTDAAEGVEEDTGTGGGGPAPGSPAAEPAAAKPGKGGKAAADDDEPHVEPPFASPSGLSAAEREADDDPPPEVAPPVRRNAGKVGGKQRAVKARGKR
jgi:phage gp29-like protein